MKRAIAAALLASTLLTGLSAARAETARAQGQADSGGRTMDAPYLAVPVVRDGMLHNYLFVSVRFDISPSVDLWRTREQAAFLRDALVRACHVNPLDDPNDPNVLNQARAISVFLATARQVLGPQAVRGVSILSTYSSRGAAH